MGEPTTCGSVTFCCSRELDERIWNVLLGKDNGVELMAMLSALRWYTVGAGVVV